MRKVLMIVGWLRQIVSAQCGAKVVPRRIEAADVATAGLPQPAADIGVAVVLVVGTDEALRFRSWLRRQIAEDRGENDRVLRG